MGRIKKVASRRALLVDVEQMLGRIVLHRMRCCILGIFYMIKSLSSDYLDEVARLTAADFRRIALGLPEAVEGSHFGNADFRVGGKIFATLSLESEGYGVLLLTPEQQAGMVEDEPEIFRPSPEDGDERAPRGCCWRKWRRTYWKPLCERRGNEKRRSVSCESEFNGLKICFKVWRARNRLRFLTLEAEMQNPGAWSCLSVNLRREQTSIVAPLPWPGGQNICWPFGDERRILDISRGIHRDLHRES